MASSDTGGTSGGNGEAIAKDGSLAPLEQPDGGGTDTSTIAMSGNDVAAQQDGEQMAAEAAEGSSGADATTRSGAIQEARTALARGDEAACLDAIERAKSL
ncbi:hypothetical protein [Rhodobacter sp. NSM]|uniref:hypothetical protein n=1 Tax=Rhodobacter sp. NSM TaxID=3457501 RepID=UPI003FD541F8